MFLFPFFKQKIAHYTHSSESCHSHLIVYLGHLSLSIMENLLFLLYSGIVLQYRCTKTYLTNFLSSCSQTSHNTNNSTMNIILHMSFHIWRTEFRKWDRSKGMCIWHILWYDFHQAHANGFFYQPLILEIKKTAVQKDRIAHLVRPASEWMCGSDTQVSYNLQRCVPIYLNTSEYTVG